MLSNSINIFQILTDSGIDTVKLKKLLDLLGTPSELTGISDVIPNLLKSARSISNLAPSVSELVQLLENVNKKIDLFPKSHASHDLNALAGRYEEYPAYSVFSQLGRMNEPKAFTESFYLVCGLLLATIWLSNVSWNPPPKGYAEFLRQLRRLRRLENYSELSAIPTDSTSLQEFVSLLSGPLKGVPYKVQQLATNHIRVTSRSDWLDDSQNKIKQPRHPDSGNDDEWQVGRIKISRPVVTERPVTLKTNSIVLRDPPSQDIGVDTAELEVLASIVESEPSSDTKNLPDKDFQSFQGLNARFATEFENQFLPYSWESLNEYEVSTLVQAIIKTLGSSTETHKHQLGALITGLSILTSRRPEELADFKIIRNVATTTTSIPCILMNESCWYSPFPPLERFKPTTEQSKWLINIENGSTLPLPAEIVASLAKFTKSGKTLGDLLGLSPEEIDEHASAFCKSIRKDARVRVNVSWLRSIMFHRMLSISNDEIGTIATLGNAEHAPSVGLYYASFDQNKWRAIYNQGVASLGFTSQPLEEKTSAAYGSRQLPDINKLNEWISNFAESAAKSCYQINSIDDLVAAHNSYASYTFLLLLANSGHRPAETYTFGPKTLDLDNGWAIISDKITSPTTRVRLIPLAEIVVQQLTNYKKHLHNLSTRLAAYDIVLATKISLLASPLPHSLLPYFFYIDNNLEPSAIDMSSIALKYGYPYERNSFRHFLATGLRDEGVSSEYIAILLAHVENGQYGFGKFSALSPIQWKDTIAPALGKVLNTQGWKIIAGIPHLRKSLPDFQHEQAKLRLMPEINVFSKAVNHVQESQQDRRVVRAAFTAAKRNTSKNSSKDEFLSAFRSEILSASANEPDRLARRLNFHVRYIRMHRNALQPSSIPGMATDMQVEDAIFEPNTLVLAKLAKFFRKAIPEISDRFDDLTHDQRFALIIVSSVLFGALLREDLIKQLQEKIIGGVRSFKGKLWIEFDDPQSGGCQRWFPDPATALLISRFLKKEEVKLVLHSNHIRTSISFVLAELSPNGQAVKSISTLKELLSVGKAFFSLHLPGVLRAFATGEVRSASLNEGAWLRLLSGFPIRVTPLTEQLSDKESIRPHVKVASHQDNPKVIYSELFTLIRSEFPPASSSAINKKGTRVNRLSALSRKLSEQINTTDNIPPVLYAIMTWAYHLATEGSVLTKKPTIETIYSYVTSITKPLSEFGVGTNFFELSEAELTDIYQRVLEFGLKSTRSSRAKSLRWFHEFCEETFDLPELDWGEIAPGSSSNQTYVSANLISFVEYQHAKDLLHNHPSLSIRDRQMLELGLILLYRTGLRLGELMRLTVSDVVIGTKNILLIRNGIYGKTKSRAGVRQIPWLDRLTNEEIALLNDWLSHRKIATKNDPWGALFGEPDEDRTLEARIKISRILTNALRTVTGDPTVKVHHLRHGAGTSALSLALSNRLIPSASHWFSSTEADIAAEFRSFHLGNDSPTRRIIWAVSQALGHSSPRTTIWHYGHSLDLTLGEHVEQLCFLRNVDIARLSGISQNNLNVAFFKNPTATVYTIALAVLLKSAKGLSPQTKLEENHFVFNSDVFAPRIQPLSSPKLAHIILTDLSNGFSFAQISYRYMREELEIKLIDEAARKIERKTGYRVFRTINSEKNSDQNHLLQSRYKSLSKLLTGHAESLIPQFKAALEKPSSLLKIESGVNVWLDNYQYTRSGLRIPYPVEIDKFIELLNLVGISNSQIFLTGNSVEKLSLLADQTTLTNSMSNFIQRGAKYRSTKRTPLGTFHSPTLLVSTTRVDLNNSTQSTRGSASLGMQKIHHLLFLSSVLITYRQKTRMLIEHESPILQS